MCVYIYIYIHIYIYIYEQPLIDMSYMCKLYFSVTSVFLCPSAAPFLLYFREDHVAALPLPPCREAAPVVVMPLAICRRRNERSIFVPLRYARCNVVTTNESFLTSKSSLTTY